MNERDLADLRDAGRLAPSPVSLSLVSADHMLDEEAELLAWAARQIQRDEEEA